MTALLLIGGILFILLGVIMYRYSDEMGGWISFVVGLILITAWGSHVIESRPSPTLVETQREKLTAFVNVSSLQGRWFLLGTGTLGTISEYTYLTIDTEGYCKQHSVPIRQSRVKEIVEGTPSIVTHTWKRSVWYGKDPRYPRKRYTFYIPAGSINHMFKLDIEHPGGK